MSNVVRYVPGMLQIMHDGRLYLPHSCDSWVIGGELATRALIADLEAALTGFYQPGQSYDGAYERDRYDDGYERSDDVYEGDEGPYEEVK